MITCVRIDCFGCCFVKFSFFFFFDTTQHCRMSESRFDLFRALLPVFNILYAHRNIQHWTFIIACLLFLLWRDVVFFCTNIIIICKMNGIRFIYINLSIKKTIMCLALTLFHYVFVILNSPQATFEWKKQWRNFFMLNSNSLLRFSCN